MANEANIPISALRQLLTYDPDTGRLMWLKRPREFFPTFRAWRIWNGRYAGTEALTYDSYGYRTGNIFNRRMKAHRVGYALHFGAWPVGSIDHINGDTADNRIVNLREVDHLANMQNQRMKKTNKSGVTGVTRLNRKWKAQIFAEGKAHNLGHFSTFDEAVAARKQAERKFGFHPNHGLPRV